MRIVGIDPGLANVGVAVVTAVSGIHIVDSLQVITTKKDGPKKKTWGDDSFDRARQISSALEPIIESASLLVIEAMSFPRSSTAASKMSLCYGVIAALAESTGCDVIQISPKRIKKIVSGSSKAEKDEIQEIVEDYFDVDSSLWVSSTPKYLRNHAYDALAAILAGIKEGLWSPPL